MRIGYFPPHSKKPSGSFGDIGGNGGKPGGAGDISGRLSAKAAEAVLGQPIKVINKLGGGLGLGIPVTERYYHSGCRP